ncbi:four helix bundle protein [uncultured Rubinisphaera sp.]|uniref:four helix bundle protein n=1 Tax=uncultured Rubinisphaera sp. TaxID=1678686 RepID=UPI0030DD3B72
MTVFRFQKLEVWNRAIEFGDDVYEISSTFPGDERFGLTSQIRRAVLSISSNIAEGTGRPSNQDFARFVEIAYGSLMEVVSQLEFAKRRGYISEEMKSKLFTEAEIIAKQLSNLRSSLRNRKQNP